MEGFLNAAQILVSIVLIMVILAQVREMGSGMFGSAQGGARTRRGLEKTLFQFTIIMGIVFLAISVASARLT